MAQRNIDFGTFPDDPDADAIRTAFEKTQQNFTELFAGISDQGVLSVNRIPGSGITVSPVTGNVVVSANIFSVPIITSTLAISNVSATTTVSGGATLTQSATQSLYINLPANITGVTSANFSNTVTASALVANTSITSSNTITATGNITGGNLSTSGALAVTGNMTAGNVSATSITGTTLSGTLTTAAQPNITSVGTLTGLSVSGNLVIGTPAIPVPTTLPLVSGIVQANYFVGDGRALQNVSAAPGSLIINANTEINIPSPNSSIFMSVAGTANVLIVNQTGINVAGTLSATGNLTSANANLGNAAQANYFIGNFYGTANNATTATSATTAGTVTTAAQPNITSVGTLSSLTVTANVTAGNIFANSGTVRGNLLTGTLTTASQPNITSVGTLTSLTVTGKVTAGQLQGDGGNISNVQASNVSGTVANATYATSAGSASTATSATTAGTVTTNAQPNITSVGTLSSLTVTGKVTAGQLQGDGGNISNVQGANVSGAVTYATTANSVAGANVSGQVANALVAGTVYTAAQPNITSVGTLTGVNVNGNITAANITANTGIFTGNGSGLTNLAGANVTGTVANATYATSAGSATTATTATTAGTVTTNAQPNITSVGTLSSLSVTGKVTAGQLQGEGGNISNVQGSNITGAVSYATTANSVAGANVSGTVANATYAVSAGTAGTVTTNAQPNITSVGTLSSLAVTGNATAGNVYANSGTIGASLLSGTLTTAAQPNITSVGTLTGLSVNGNITAANVTANTGVFTGNAAGLTNIPGANVTGTVSSATTAGTVTTAAQPNITSVGTLSNLSVTGNVTAGNINGGNVISANYFSGDGSLLTNISVSTGSYIINGNSEVRVDANSNVRFNVNGTSNIVVVSNTGLTANGNVTATLFNGTLATAAQPNITSLGTLTGLTVSGTTDLGAVGNVRISGGSNNQFLVSTGVGSNLAFINATTLTTAPGSNTQVLFNDAGSFQANANMTFDKTTGTLSSQALSVTANIIAGNVYANSGTIRGSLLTGTLTTAAQPNITSLGTLTGLIVNGNINAGNVSGGNLVSANFVSGTLTTASQPNITTVGTLGSLTVTNKVTAGQLQGEGGNISNIQGANVSGTVANATYATSAGSATTATTAGTVTTNAQPNITSVGTLTGLTVNGNTVIGRTTVNPGTVTSNLHALTVLQTWNNSSVQFSAIEANITDTASAANSLLLDLQISNVSKFAVSKEGNIFYSGVITGNGSGLSAIAGANVTGTVSSATSATNASALLQNTSSATTVYPTFTTSSANGNSSAVINTGISANLSNASITATTFVGSLSGAATTAGTVTTNAQPNITSVGTLSSLTVTGNTTVGNLIGPHANGNSNVNIPSANGNVNISAAGNANILVVTGTGVNVSGTLNATGAGTIGGDLGVTGNAIITGNLAVNGNLTYLNTETVAVEDPIINLQTGANGAAPTSNSGKDVGSALNYYDTQARIAFMGWDVSNVEFGLASQASITNEVVTFTTYGNLRVGNIIGNGQALTGLAGSNVTGQVGNALVAGTVYTNAQPNITSVGTLTSLAVTGNVTAGNLIGPHANGNSNVNIPTAAGNVNISVNGTANVAVITATGVNVAGTLNATGNANVGNIGATNGVFTNVSGNGANLSSITGANVTGTVTSATNAAAVLNNVRTTGTYYPALISSTANGNYALNANSVFSANIATGTFTATTFSGTLNSSGAGYTVNVNSSSLYGNAISNTTPYTVRFTRSRTGPDNVVSGDSFGVIEFAGSTLNALLPSANIQAIAEATPGISDDNPATALTFATAIANAGSASEKVRITSTGNLGVGNSAPTHKVSIAGTLFASGNANVGNIGAAAGVFTTVAGSLTTAAQPNITSTGTLTGLTVSGNITAQANVNMTGYVLRSVNAAVSAAGTVQGNATAITKEMNVVSTVASGAGVILPTAVAGMAITIINTSANALLVYPHSGGDINGGAINAAYSQPAGATLQFVAPTTTDWYTVGATFA